MRTRHSASKPQMHAKHTAFCQHAYRSVRGVTTSFGALPAYSQEYLRLASAMDTVTRPSCNDTLRC